MQISLEGRLAADGFWLAVGDDGALVTAVRGIMKPDPVTVTEVLFEHSGVGCCELADAMNAEGLQPGSRFRAYAIDTAGWQ